MDIEYHVNHVQDICSPECIPPPDWRQVSGQLLDVVIEERNTLRARLADVEALHFATASTAGLYATNCGGCSHSWPCPTVRAAARGEGDRPVEPPCTCDGPVTQDGAQHRTWCGQEGDRG